LYVNAVRGEHVRCDLSKLTAVIAAVIGNRDRYLLTRKAFHKVVGESLRGHANVIPVDAICPGTHNATKPPGTKLQVFVKTVNEHLTIGAAHQLTDFTFGVVIDQRTVKPLPGFFQHLLLYISCHGYRMRPKIRKDGLFGANGVIFFGVSVIQRLPRRACSRSMASNNALKLPFPNEVAPLRWMIS